VTHVPPGLNKVMDTASCPIVAGVPEVMKAAFTKETDFFETRGIEYLDPSLTFSEMNLTAKRMFETWAPRLGVTQDECDHAHREGLAALDQFDRDLQDKGRAILETVEAENRIAIIMVGRPYHSDPGLNHGIPEEFQVLGYPILSVRSIPRDIAYLNKWFKTEAARGQHPLDINDVWPENYSANSAQKVWAVKFAARHPNVALLDLSSFKCGHDAPTYGLIDSIIASAGKAYSALHDIDANKPSGSIKIRVKTYAHTLMLLKEKLEDQAVKKNELDRAMALKKLELMKQLQAKLAGVGRTDDKLVAEVAAIEALAQQWAAEEAVKNPKAKKLAALNVINNSGAGSSSSANLAKANKESK
jgi:predicted nucleotide-binding protein (sugar kinase/HSP70/actin superfamily)